MAQLLERNFQLLGVISRLGINFRFGEDTVAEVCRRDGVNTSTFLLICNVYSIPGYTPTEDFLANVDLDDIVKYLKRSHSYYMGEVKGGLREAIDKLTEPCDAGRKKVIMGFYHAYEDELEKHFQYEETIVFPYVKAVLAKTAGKDFSIARFEENHTNVDEKLGDLKNIVMKYMPPQCDNALISDVLWRLFMLQLDLEKHTFIEDNILVPVVNRLENNE